VEELGQFVGMKEAKISSQYVTDQVKGRVADSIGARQCWKPETVRTLQPAPKPEFVQTIQAHALGVLVPQLIVQLDRDGSFDIEVVTAPDPGSWAHPGRNVIGGHVFCSGQRQVAEPCESFLRRNDMMLAAQQVQVADRPVEPVGKPFQHGELDSGPLEFSGDLGVEIGEAGQALIVRGPVLVDAGGNGLRQRALPPLA